MIALAILIRSLKTAIGASVMIGVFSASRTPDYLQLAAFWAIKSYAALVVSDPFLTRSAYFFFHFVILNWGLFIKSSFLGLLLLHPNYFFSTFKFNR